MTQHTYVVALFDRKARRAPTVEVKGENPGAALAAAWEALKASGVVKSDAASVLIISVAKGRDVTPNARTVADALAQGETDEAPQST